MRDWRLRWRSAAGCWREPDWSRNEVVAAAAVAETDAGWQYCCCCCGSADGVAAAAALADSERAPADAGSDCTGRPYAGRPPSKPWRNWRRQQPPPPPRPSPNPA